TLVFLTLFYRSSPRIIYIQKALIQFKMAENEVQSFMRFKDIAAKTVAPTEQSFTLDHLQSLELQNVSKVMIGNQALTNISLKISRGSSCAIFGSTGSGKTTILDMLLGLQEPDSGRILANGKDLNSINLKSHYEKVSLVCADDDLIPGTL